MTVGKNVESNKGGIDPITHLEAKITLQNKIGRNPSERPARPRDDRGVGGGDPGQHPAFLQRPPAPQRAGAPAGGVEDDEFED